MIVILAIALLSAEPVPAPSTLRARVLDPDVVRAAVKKAVASTPVKAANRQETVLSGDPYQGFARAVDEAQVPGCLRPDALKHQPPQIGPIIFDGLMALPFWLTAIVRGKCN